MKNLPHFRLGDCLWQRPQTFTLSGYTISSEIPHSAPCRLGSSPLVTSRPAQSTGVITSSLSHPLQSNVWNQGSSQMCTALRQH